MTTTPMIQELAALKRKREEKFHALVREVADGKHSDAETVLKVLDGAGKTLEEYDAAVKLALQRKRAAEEIKAAEAAAAELVKLEAQIERELAKLRKAEAAYEQAVAPLRGRKEELEAIAQAGHFARNLLVTTADSAVRAEVEAVAKEAAAARHDLSEARERLRATKYEVSFLVENRKAVMSRDHQDELDEQIKKAKAREDAIEAALREAERVCVAKETRSQEVSQKLYEL